MSSFAAPPVSLARGSVNQLDPLMNTTEKYYDEEDEDDGDGEEEEESTFCTYSVTGSSPSFQATYICETCTSQSSSSKTITQSFCEACIQCHENHDVVFVGLLDSSCDCRSTRKGGCCISAKSDDEAKKIMDVINGGNMVHTLPRLIAEKDAINEENGGSTKGDAVKECSLLDMLAGNIISAPAQATTKSRLNSSFKSFTLQNSASSKPFPSKLLNHYSQQLIKQTKETHFLSLSRCASPPSSLHPLENYAAQVLNFHLSSNPHLFTDIATGIRSDINELTTGAEWWVQVKPTTPSLLQATSSSSLATTTNTKNSKLQAIDLHYDKDEEIALKFGLGSFPTLSTVTYLSHHPLNDNARASASTGKGSGEQRGTFECKVSPTLIFDHIYTDEESQVIKSTGVSYPVLCKHIVFDGRLLHGAPANAEFRNGVGIESSVGKGNNGTVDDEEAVEDDMRVTYMVNIWINNRPCIYECSRELLDSLAPPPSPTEELELNDGVIFLERNIGVVEVVESDVNEDEEMMTLHFVDRGATWLDDADYNISDARDDGDDNEEGEDEEEEEEDEGLVLKMHPFPKNQLVDDTMVFNYYGVEERFMPGLVNLGEDFDSEDEDEDENNGKGESREDSNTK